MTMPQVTLCYLDPDWQIDIKPPSAANAHQYVIQIDRVTILVGEDDFPRFLHDFRSHLDDALSDSEHVERERMSHVGEVR